MSRQRAYRNTGPLPPHPYCYSRYILDQDHRAPCTWDLICNIQDLHQQGNSSRGRVEDEGVRVPHHGWDHSRLGGANQVYPGGLLRGRGELEPISGSEYSPERILPGPGRRSIWVRGRYVKVWGCRLEQDSHWGGFPHSNLLPSVPLFMIFVWCHVRNECSWEKSLVFWKVRDEMVWKDKIPDNRLI